MNHLRTGRLNRFLNELNRNRGLNYVTHLIEMTPDLGLVFLAGVHSFAANLNLRMKS